MYERSPPLSLAKRQTQPVEFQWDVNAGTATTVESIAAHVRLPRRAPIEQRRSEARAALYIDIAKLFRTVGVAGHMEAGQVFASVTNHL